MPDKRIHIFAGHFGSGKTEVALNFAIRAANSGKKVTIVDLDIVNPYFRTNDAKAILEEHGIRVIASQFANSNLDLPSVPQNLASIFYDEDAVAIIDVGGDEDGAFALGQYKDHLEKAGYEFYMVVNAKRPMMEEDGAFLSLAKLIEQASRLQITGVINNTNLGALTDTETLLSGCDAARDLARQLDVPVAMQSGFPQVLSGLSEDLEGSRLPMQIYIKMPWER